MRSCTALSLGVMLVMGVILAVSAQAQTPSAQNGQPSAEAPAKAAPPAEVAPSKPAAPAKKKYDPRDLCVTPEDAASELLNKRRQIGGRIILDTFLLPTGGNVDVGLDEPFSESEYYFSALDLGASAPVIMDRPDGRVRRLTPMRSSERA